MIIYRKYLIQRVKKDSKDNIIKVRTRTAEFSPAEAAEKIKEGHTFVIRDKNGEVLVKAVSRKNKPYLRTVADSKSGNNLDNLPQF